jgi:hypothetical protein
LSRFVDIEAIMKTKKTLLIGAALLLGVLAPARAEILVGFITGLSGPVSSIGVPNAKRLAAGQAYIGEIDSEISLRHPARSQEGPQRQDGGVHRPFRRF